MQNSNCNVSHCLQITYPCTNDKNQLINESKYLKTDSCFEGARPLQRYSLFTMTWKVKTILK